MPRTTLQRRLTLLFAVIIAGVVGLIALFLGVKGEEMLFEQARTAGSALARGLAAASLADFVNYNFIGLEQKAEETGRDPQVAFVILYDKEGQVAAFTGQGAALAGDRPPPLSADAAEAKGVVAASRQLGTPPGPGLDILQPVLLPATGQRWGTVRLGYRLDDLYAGVRRLRWTLFLLGVGGVLVGGLASLLFTRRITVPLRELVQATVRVAEGDYQPRPVVAAGDEVGELAGNFETMVGRLREQRDALEANMERIRRADRLAAVGTLASGLAHEIRNPLAAVRAFVQMVPEKYASEAFRQRFDRTVPRELDRVNGLLEDLLDLVRKPRMNLGRVDAGETLECALDALEPQIAGAGIRVELDRGEKGHFIGADPAYLQRAFGNLLLNAVQAMPDGGTLTVRLGRAHTPGGGPAVTVTISDTGFGISRENMENLFNPFFTSKEKGTGLGLAVTHKIVEDLKGTISVQSERGEWTTFTLSFPAYSREISTPS